MTPTEWKTACAALARNMALCTDSREATRAEAEQACRAFTDHLDLLDSVLLETYAEGMAEGRAEMNRRIG